MRQSNIIATVQPDAVISSTEVGWSDGMQSKVVGLVALMLLVGAVYLGLLGQEQILDTVVSTCGPHLVEKAK